jgi:hypothetical protein
VRSHLERFRMKVTTIESCTDFNTMRIEELVGALQTYEFSLPQPRKNKDLALRTLKKNADEDSLGEEELALIAKRFYRNEHRISKRFENKKRVLRIRMKETHAVQNVMSVLTMIMFTRIVVTSRVISQTSRKPSILP